ncbi:HEPN domain-containing protein [Parapedobacter soli]|uniref:HEPN domain-containing protein n=1 Tax=Parapedobacter soli TaxID=416955 RepID=UPI0021C5AAF6|nr:HEPN domain-containing protein [Parapedobacter soli]
MMNPYLHMNSGGIAKHNDFSTHDDSQTTNHIYLHPGPNQGEFDNWMRKIGSLLQVVAEHTALKPVLELITAVFEPQRLFLINHPALPELDVEAYTEILVVMDGSQITSKKITKGMLDMACFPQKNVVMHFETANRIERGIEDGHPRYCTVCTEEHLVFSGSPYRLAKPTEETLEKLKDELPELRDRLFTQSEVFLSEAKRMLESQSSNLAALMLHHCVEHLYKNILFGYNHKFYTTHRIAKLQSKVEKCMLQVCAQLNRHTIDALDTTLSVITTPYCNVEEIWNAERVFDEVGNTLKIAKALFEKRATLLSGGSGNPYQSGDSEEPAAQKKEWNN